MFRSIAVAIVMSASLAHAQPPEDTTTSQQRTLCRQLRDQFEDAQQKLREILGCASRECTMQRARLIALIKQSSDGYARNNCSRFESPT